MSDYIFSIDITIILIVVRPTVSCVKLYQRGRTYMNEGTVHIYSNSSGVKIILRTLSQLNHFNIEVNNVLH